MLLTMNLIPQLLGLSEREKCIWLAALFDGEGAYGIQQTYGKFVVNVKLCNTNQLLLDEIIRQIGFGRLEKYRWSCDGKVLVSRFIDMIEPYLVGRRDETELFRAVISTVADMGKRPTLEQLTLREKLMPRWYTRSEHAKVANAHRLSA